jgi:hypothetical protein
MILHDVSVMCNKNEYTALFLLYLNTPWQIAISETYILADQTNSYFRSRDGER